MTEAGKGAEEVQDILLKNVAMFQKVCDRIQFEGVSRSEFAMLHMIHNKKDERGKLTLRTGCLFGSIIAGGFQNDKDAGR